MAARLRVSRVAFSGRAPTGRLRVATVAFGATGPTARLRVSQVAFGAGTPGPSAAAFVTVAPDKPALPWQLVTLSVTPQVTPGDSVTGVSWSAVSTGAAPLSDPTKTTTKLRVLPSTTGTTYTYQVTVTTAAGASVTKTVDVPVPATRMFTIDTTGGTHPAGFIGTSPTYPQPSTPPPATARIRVRRVAFGSASAGGNPTPTPSAMLLGARCNFPPGEPGTDNTVTGDFAHGEDVFGPLQITLDYFGSKNLPATYKSPYPARVRVLMSMSTDVDLTQANFNTFIASLPSGTLLTFQHEPERPRFTWTGAQYVTALNAFRAQVRAIRTDCPVGIKSSGYQYKANSSTYDQVSSGQFMNGLTVDYYAFDAYRNGTNSNAQGMGLTDILLRDEFKLWKSFVPAGKPWGIGESGFGRVGEDGLIPDIVAQRQAHTKSSVEALAAAGCAFFIYFFSSEGPDGHFWLPSGEPGFCTMYKNLARGTGTPLI